MDQGEGWLATLVPLRADIIAGDPRSLYLGWLLCVQEGVLEDDAVAPPTPPGLHNLSASLQSLVEFLRIEDDLLQVVAEDSPANLNLSPSVDEANRWLRSLPDADKNEILLRLVRGDLPSLRAEVSRRIRESGAVQRTERPDSGDRTVGELLALADRRH